MPAWKMQTLANGDGGVATQTPPLEHDPAMGVVAQPRAVVVHVAGGIDDVGCGLQVPA